MSDLTTRLPAEFPGIKELAPEVQYLMGCRSFEQYCCTLRALADPAQYCPFCEAERARRGRKELMSVGDWILLGNEFPRKDVQTMQLIVPRRHLKSIGHIRPQDAADFFLLLQQSKIESGGLLMRFGDPRFHVGTIEHVHFNVVEPKPGIACRLPLAKALEELVEDFMRTRGFEQELLAHGGDEWLFSDAGIKATQPAVLEPAA